MDTEIKKTLARLRQSPFRRRFRIDGHDLALVHRKGIEVIRQHAEEFVHGRLSSSEPKNDGRQTPMKGHPVFKAQHATATCCRKCLAKWHGVARGRKLTDTEVNYIIRLIIGWIELQLDNSESREQPKLDKNSQNSVSETTIQVQKNLFDPTNWIR